MVDLVIMDGLFVGRKLDEINWFFLIFVLKVSLEYEYLNWVFVCGRWVFFMFFCNRFFGVF